MRRRRKIAESESKGQLVVVNVVDVPSPEPGRAGKMDKLITYEKDPLHRYMIRIPEEEATEERIVSAIQTDWAKRRAWIGRVIAEK